MRVLAPYLLLMLIAMGSTGYTFGGKAKAIGARLYPQHPALITPPHR